MKAKFTRCFERLMNIYWSQVATGKGNELLLNLVLILIRCDKFAISSMGMARRRKTNLT